ncbi:MAG TPA: orotidine-5'-phosphate decarboxylase [Thermoanaerobaculia bacterium]|jgi:orotidine-5'-phosphate decarboxylase|nr:orotidine-5'-phosphate decarboxylase [Thermoanaerobaculia bacterium]
MQPHDRLVVAVDLSARDEILRLVDTLHGSVGVFKIGLQAFVANGPEIVRDVVARGERVFLDLKIHDIPNTARHAVAEAAFLGASIATVHIAGGESMLRACNHHTLLVLGVTVLTSLTETDLVQIGFGGTAVDNAVRLARLAQGSGLRGVVASPLEIERIREACGKDFVILTPGIRPKGSDVGDQQRVMTPGEAVRAGADYIVVGRPITGAADPRSAARRVVEEMSAI